MGLWLNLLQPFVFLIRVGDTGQGLGGIVVSQGREPAGEEANAIAAAAAVAEAAFYNALRWMLALLHVGLW